MRRVYLTQQEMLKFMKERVKPFSSEALIVVSLRKPNILAISPRNFTTIRLPHFTVTLLEVSSYDKTTSVKLDIPALYKESITSCTFS